ncbi:MAG: hypothetical protein EXQ52_09245 [Bryobacterales bacterium]|nr:hypothetical protein [Bryobacterales bacterium]
MLWFEHDLYDQLQLVQLLAWFAEHDTPGVRLSLIQSPTYLGALEGEALAKLLPTRATVTGAQLAQALDAWKAYRAPEPTGLLEPRPALPFLDAAFHRFAEEYPSVRDGLSRTERQLLQAVAEGNTTRAAIYEASSEMEEAVFIGDAPAWALLDELVLGSAPAVVQAGHDQYRISAHGERTLAGHSDWIRSRGAIDRWLGGVHLDGVDAASRWDCLLFIPMV